MANNRLNVMTIRRAPHDTENKYFQHRRATAQDKTLSYEALGVLTYLLSKPGDWEIMIDDLIRPGSGRDKIYKIITELVEHRHMEGRKKTRTEKGTWEWSPYILHEEPYPEKPDTVSPDTVNQEILHIRDGQNKEKESAVATERSKQEIEIDAMFNGTSRKEWKLLMRGWGGDTNFWKRQGVMWQIGARYCELAELHPAWTPEQIDEHMQLEDKLESQRRNGIEPEQEAFESQVFSVWGYPIGSARCTMLAQMLRGVSTNTTYKPGNIPILYRIKPDELPHWYEWEMKQGVQGDDKILIESPVKIQSSVMAWVTAGKPKISDPKKTLPGAAGKLKWAGDKAS